MQLYLFIAGLVVYCVAMTYLYRKKSREATIAKETQVAMVNEERSKAKIALNELTNKFREEYGSLLDESTQSSKEKEEDYEDKIIILREKHMASIAATQKACDDAISNIKAECDKRIKSIGNDCDKKVKEIRDDCEKRISDSKHECERKIKQMKEAIESDRYKLRSKDEKELLIDLFMVFKVYADRFNDVESYIYKTTGKSKNR